MARWPSTSTAGMALPVRRPSRISFTPPGTADLARQAKGEAQRERHSGQA